MLTIKMILNHFRKPSESTETTLIQNKEQEFIVEGLDDIIQRMEETRSRFDFVTDEDLIEAYTYEMKSLDAKYNYYLKKARSEKIKNKFVLSGRDLPQL